MYQKSISYLLGLVFSVLSFSAIADNTAEKWEQIKDKDGIKVYKRDFNDSDFFEFKGEVEAKTSLSSVVALLFDTDRMASWMHRAEEARLLEQVSDRERLAYMSFSFTVLPDRDIVLRNKVQQDPETLKVTYSMDFVESHEALDESGKGHIEGLVGKVTVEPIGSGNVKIVYQAHIEPGNMLTGFPLVGPGITNALLKATPFETLKNAREILNEEQYQSATFDFITEPSTSNLTSTQQTTQGAI